MTAIRKLVPSMFHRRLLLLRVVIWLGLSVLGGQLYRLTVVQGQTWREEAESVLSSKRLLPTVRGRILDRHGRVLAEDRPCYDVTVSYPVITGAWAYREARRLAYRDYRSAWGQMSFDEREALIGHYQEPFDARIEAMWQTLAEVGGVEREEISRRKQTIVQRVQTIRTEVWSRRARQRAAERGGPVELSGVAIPIAEEREDHTILGAIDDEAAHQIQRVLDDLPGVSLSRSRTREYPLRAMTVSIDRSTLPSSLRRDDVLEVHVDRLGSHIVGSMREAWAEDVADRPYRRGDGEIDLGGYLPGDTTGFDGIERLMEDHLRGIRGQVVRRRDTDEEQRIPPQPGGDVNLTIDMGLQARIRALMDPELGLTRVQGWHENERTPLGTDLFGAAVVLEVDSGDVLALVSTPAPPIREHGEPYPDLTRDPDRPDVNRALGGIYAPGSTLKPIVYLMAASAGLVGVDEPIDCQGHLLPDREDIYRCWGWRPAQNQRLRHGPLGPGEAIARSCNIYFYESGRLMGGEALVAGLREWGFGERAGLLSSEVGGLIGPRGREMALPDTVMMGIGQGPIAVPPLQVASAHAAMARGGYWLAPVMIDERRNRQESRDLRIAPDALANAIQGMHDSTYEMDYGTGAALTLPDGTREPVITLDDVTVRSKTGTAQTSPQVIEDENGERRVVRAGNHSWYVSHVQRPGEQRAAYIVAVMIEYGGSGGRVSGPVANQIIHALREEGYL